jgi:hypothetical protein
MKPGAIYTEFGDDYVIMKHGDRTYYWTNITTIAAEEGKVQKGLQLSNGNWSFYHLEDESYIDEILQFHLSQSD